jgi:hypothetical protein
MRIRLSETGGLVLTLDHAPASQAQCCLGNSDEHGEGDIAIAGTATPVISRSHSRQSLLDIDERMKRARRDLLCHLTQCVGWCATHCATVRDLSVVFSEARTEFVIEFRELCAAEVTLNLKSCA